MFTFLNDLPRLKARETEIIPHVSSIWMDHEIETEFELRLPEIETEFEVSTHFYIIAAQSWLNSNHSRPQFPCLWHKIDNSLHGKEMLWQSSVHTTSTQSHCLYYICFSSLDRHIFFLYQWEKVQPLMCSEFCRGKQKPRPRSGIRNHLHWMPSPQPSPQHQMESILIPARGALLCKGQEGVGRGHVEQGWDPVGNSSLVFLLEQRIVEGTWCHFFQDLCKDSKTTQYMCIPRYWPHTTSALSNLILESTREA